MTGAQGVYDTATQDYLTQQKIAEIQRQNKQRTAFDTAAESLYKTTPAQYATEQVSGGGYLPQTPDVNAVAPNFGLSKTYAPATTQQVMTAPEKQEMSPTALNAMLLSGDPRATAYLTGLETIKKLQTPAKVDLVNVAEGGSVYDPNQGKIVAVGSPKQVKPSNFIENYEYAVNKGYTGSPADWQKLTVEAAQQFQAPYKRTEQEATEAATDYRYKRPQNFSVTAGGKVFYFPDQKSADAFRAQTKPKARK
jgi:hypothetical protein